MNAFGGDSYGQVTLDGELLSKEVFKKRCYLVAQQESHWSSLTCVETLMYAAQLYLGRSAAEVETYVDDLLRRTGLASCKVCPCVCRRAVAPVLFSSSIHPHAFEGYPSR